MAALKDEAIRRWWPTTQSLDLVEEFASAVAHAVHAEFTRILKGEPVELSRHRLPDLAAAFRNATDFHNVPTYMLALPTRSKWTVLWNNSFLCDGYDSLCANLTSRHGLTTIHWSAHDTWTASQSGAHFTHRKLVDGAVIKRSVAAAQNDKSWAFEAYGEALPEENLVEYEARRKRDRLNEGTLMALLERLGARPWCGNFYALPEQECFSIHRPFPPSTVLARPRSEVLRPLQQD